MLPNGNKTPKIAVTWYAISNSKLKWSDIVSMVPPSGCSHSPPSDSFVCIFRWNTSQKYCHLLQYQNNIRYYAISQFSPKKKVRTHISMSCCFVVCICLFFFSLHVLSSVFSFAIKRTTTTTAATLTKKKTRHWHKRFHFVLTEKSQFNKQKWCRKIKRKNEKKKKKSKELL